MPRKRIPHRNFIREVLWLSAYNVIAVNCLTTKHAASVSRSIRYAISRYSLSGLRVVLCHTHIYLGPANHHSGWISPSSSQLRPHNLSPQFTLIAPSAHHRRSTLSGPTWDAFFTTALPPSGE